MPQTILTVGLIVVGLLFLIAIIAAVIYLSRAHSLNGRIGSFPCSLRYDGRQDWHAGIAQYGVDRLDWFKVFSIDPRPAESWRRTTFLVQGPPEPVLVDGQTEPIIRARCIVGSQRFELVMGADAYSGMASWLEAAPPGREPASY